MLCIHPGQEQLNELNGIVKEFPLQLSTFMDEVRPTPWPLIVYVYVIYTYRIYSNIKYFSLPKISIDEQFVSFSDAFLLLGLA